MVVPVCVLKWRVLPHLHILSICNTYTKSSYTTEVFLVLYELLVSKTGPKCNCLVDLFVTSLLNTCAYTHAHCRSLLKLDAKLDLVIDRFM